MMITASIELAPGQLVESVLRDKAQMSGTLVFVYGSALMFVLRFFAGPIAHKISPIGMMWASVTLAGLGLYWLAGAASATAAYVAATIFYVGVCFMWPTMLGITSERFPQGGAFTMGLMGFAGQSALGLIILRTGQDIRRPGRRGFIPVCRHAGSHSLHRLRHLVDQGLPCRRLQGREAEPIFVIADCGLRIAD